MPQAHPSSPSQHSSARTTTAVALIAAIGAFAIVTTRGAQQARQQQRVLGELDGAAQAVRDAGERLMLHGAQSPQWILALLASVTASAALLGFIRHRWHAWPLGALAVNVCVTAWAQVELVAMHGARGTCLYALSAMTAVVLGAACPASSLGPAAVRQPFRRIDGLSMVVLASLALVVRVYALPELPHVFNGEMIGSMLASRTLAGLRWYVPDGVLSNSTGVMHLLPQMLFYELYGTSVYSLRLAGVFYGVLTVPLLYSLAHRLAGTAAAIIASTLLACAPEQLFWSRLESTNFAPVATLAVISAYLGVAMVDRFSIGRVAAVAFWLPFGRYFYTAGAALVFYPWLQVVHAWIFVRRSWRGAWYVVPLLSLGTVLWMGALSLVLWMAGRQDIVVSNPAHHGELILRGAGEHSTLSAVDLITLQAQASWSNLVILARSLAYEGILSEWYQRATVAGAVTWMIPSVFAMAAFSVAFLLGQIHRPRAFAVLLWIALGLLPAVLSMQPTDRRVVLIFPALYLAIGIAAQGIVTLSLQRGGRLAGLLIGGLVWAATLTSGVAGLASSFLLPIQPTGVERLIEFSKPIFEKSDAIFFDTDSSWAMALAFGNADRFLAAPPCYRFVRVGEWPRILTGLPCEYTDETYRALLTPEQVEAARQAYDPQRITILIDLSMPSRDAVEMLKALLPTAEVRSNDAIDTPSFVTLTFTRADLASLTSPEVWLSEDVEATPDLATTLLAEATLKPRARTGSGSDVVVRGGLYIEETGWYDLAISPPCAAAQLIVGGIGISTPPTSTPLLTGFHSFDLHLAALSACTTPITIEARRQTSKLAAQDNLSAAEAAAHRPRPVLLDPYAARVDGARAPSLRTFSGYGEAHPFGQIRGTIVDFGVDAHDELILLTQSAEHLHGWRLNAQAEELGNWDVPIPSYLPIWGMSVAANGSSYVAAGGPVFAYDRDGQAIAAWPAPPIYSGEFAVLADGRVLSAVAQESSIYELNADGTLHTQWRQFDVAAPPFNQPISVTSDHAGTVAVLQGTNEVLLFHTALDHFEPHYVGSLRVRYSEPPTPRSIAFDGVQRLLFSDPFAATPLVYARDGTRLLAATAARDLSTRGFQAPLRMGATDRHLYVLDGQRRLWQLPKD